MPSTITLTAPEGTEWNEDAKKRLEHMANCCPHDLTGFVHPIEPPTYWVKKAALTQTHDSYLFYIFPGINRLPPDNDLVRVRLVEVKEDE